MVESSPRKTIKVVGPYVISSKIGEGDVGEAFQGYLKDDPNKLLVVKQIRVSTEGDDFLNLKKTLEEHFSPMKTLKFDYVKKLYDVVLTQNNLYMFSEFCDGGNLGSLAGKISLDNTLICMKQLIKGLLSISSQGIVHRDLKPSNIYFHEGEVKIGNLGIISFLEKPIASKCKIASKKKNPFYIAPEVFFKEDYDQKCDVWSAGVIFFELIYKKHPWYCSGMGVSELFTNITSNPLKIPEEPKVSQLIKEVLQSMLQARQDYRITFGELINHDLFQKKLPSKLLK